MAERSLCARGCGFFGSPQNKHLCSKCYNDFLKEETAKYAVNLNISTGTPATHEAETAVEVAAAATTAGLGKKRCRVCKKKVGLVGFGCRCGHMFCGSHRYPEEHSCPSDYKEKAREDLAKNNPLVKTAKLFRI